jgi:hypothetical protein
MMQFRRSQPARLLPAVALVTIGISVFSVSTMLNPGGVIALCVVFLFYWSMMAFANWLRRIVIDDESIRLFGYFGGPMVIQKSEVLTCRYSRFRANGNASPDVAFLVIRDDHGNEITVWRYGWGRQHRQLFGRLGQWLDESRCTVDDRAREMIAKAA